MKKILVILLGLIIIFSVSGCKNDIELSNGSDSLVSFSDSELNITINDLYNALEEKYGLSFLLEMLDEKILSEEYPTDDEAKSYVSNQMEAFRSGYNTESEFLEYISQYGYNTAAELEEYLLLNYKRNLVVEDYLQSLISDTDINKYYENEVIGDIRVSHILIEVETETDMTDEEKTEAKNNALAKAEEVIEKLNNKGDFSSLAKEYSKDTVTASKGGDLGFFNKGAMEEAFEEASIKLKINEYTKEPVETQYGYHIILKTEEKAKPSLDKIRQVIIEELADNKLTDDSSLQYKAMMSLREKYGFKINDKDLADQYENYMKSLIYGND